jgi:hypothetical protein
MILIEIKVKCFCFNILGFLFTIILLTYLKLFRDSLYYSLIQNSTTYYCY